MSFESPSIEEKPIAPQEDVGIKIQEKPVVQSEERPLGSIHPPEPESPKAEDYKYLIGLEQARIEDIEKEQKRKGTVESRAMEAIRSSQRKIKEYGEKIKALEG